MKVYVATKWARRTEAAAMMATLRAHGHTITHDWTEEESADGLPPGERDAHFARCAEADVRAVLRADALVLLHDSAARGAYVELGIALAADLPVVVVGGFGLHRSPMRNAPIFYWLDNVIHVERPEQVPGVLAALASAARAA